MRKYVVPLALACATLYLTLSVSAVACLFAHQAHPRSGHHPASGVAHSSLCAWACHASPTVDLPAATVLAQPVHLVAMALPVVASVPPFFSLQPAQSRAPPRS